MIDHCSYKHNLSSCEIKAWKEVMGLNPVQAWTMKSNLKYYEQDWG